ncbi:MAG TPA: hypothetical protein VGB83_10610 [Actinomycetota bacterium]
MLKNGLGFGEDRFDLRLLSRGLDLPLEIELEHLFEGLSELEPHLVPRPDEHLLKERLIPEPLDRVGGDPVGAFAVNEKLRGLLASAGDAGKGDLGFCDGGFGGCDLTIDPALLSDENVLGYQVAIGTLEELQAVGLESGEPPLLPGRFLLAPGLPRGEELTERSGDGLGALGREAHFSILTSNQLLDVVHPKILLATLPKLLFAQAEEVVVDAAVAVGFGDREPRAALIAEDRSFEVVGMGARALPGGVVGREHLLHLGEGLGSHERLVRTLILLAPVAHNARVVGVLEDRGKVRQVKRMGGTRAGRHGRQSLGGQAVEKLERAAVARRVGLERPGDERTSFGVDPDGADLAPVYDLAHVSVADADPHRAPALLGLLRASLDDLGREVVGVEFGKAGHHGVHESSGGRVVDVLRYGDQLRARLVQGDTDERVVVAVAGQAVDLVDDDVVDAAFGMDAPEHLLEFRPVGALRGLSFVGVFGEDRGIQ